MFKLEFTVHWGQVCIWSNKLYDLGIPYQQLICITYFFVPWYDKPQGKLDIQSLRYGNHCGIKHFQLFSFCIEILCEKKKPNTPTNHNTGYNTTGNQYQEYVKIAKKIITY